MSKLKCLEHKSNCNENIILCECSEDFNECLDPVCSVHVKYCDICEKPICSEHVEQCQNCKIIICTEHAIECEGCKRLFCLECLSQTRCQACYEEQFDEEEVEGQISVLKTLAKEAALDAKKLRPDIQLLAQTDVKSDLNDYIKRLEMTREELNEIRKELP